LHTNARSRSYSNPLSDDFCRSDLRKFKCKRKRKNFFREVVEISFRRSISERRQRKSRGLDHEMSADKNVSAKAMAAMLKQKKIDIAAIEAAVRE
jgi:aspartokinase